MAGPWEKYATQPAAGPWTKYAAPVEAPQQQEGMARTIFDQAMQGATFGFADEVSDRMGAGIAALATGEDYGQMLDEARKLTAERQARQWDQNPGTSIASNIAGGLVTGVPGAAKLSSTKAGAAVGNILRNSNLPTKIGAGALTGAASGGLYGYGSGQGDDRWQEAREGAVLGAIGGAAVPAAVAGFTKLNTRTILPTSDDIKKAASAAYQRADAVGGKLRPEFTNNFLESARKSLLTGDELIDAMQSNKPLAAAFDDLAVFQNQPMTLQRAQALDEQLGNMIDGFVDGQGNMTKAGKKLLDVQSSFRNMIENADEVAIEGGKEGFEALKEGRKLWASSRRLADIERIIDNAEMYQVPATAIKTGFRRLAKNARSLGYTDDEIKAIKSAAETGMVTDVMATFGNRFGGLIGAATGGVPGAVLGYGATTASRAGATASQASRANKAARMVAERSGMVRTEKRLDPAKLRDIMRLPPKQAQEVLNQSRMQKALPAPKTPQALPAPQRDFVADRSGNVRQATGAEQSESLLKRQRADSLGMTPDIRNAIAFFEARAGKELTNSLMEKYGASKLGRFIAKNPRLRLAELDEATLRGMLDEIE